MTAADLDVGQIFHVVDLPHTYTLLRKGPGAVYVRILRKAKKFDTDINRWVEFEQVETTHISPLTEVEI